MAYKLYVRVIEKPPTPKLYSGKYDIDPKMWEKIGLLPFKASEATIDSRTRIFQFQLLNNISHLNKALHKMENIESSLYSLCKEKYEAVSQLFFECHGSVALWQSMQRWCHRI